VLRPPDAGGYAAARLGVNTDHTSLISPDLPFRRYYAHFAERFPILDNAVLVVIDGETSELARSAAERLQRRLAARSDAVRGAFVPGGGPFFERNALLFLDVDELEDLADHLTRMQPVLAALERDPSIGNMAVLVQRGLEQVESNRELERSWPAILDRVSAAMGSVYTEHPIAISWEAFMLEGSSIDPVKRRVIVVDPVLDTHKLLPAARVIDAVREEARGLGLAPERGVRVRVTGNPALNHEEMIGLFWNVLVGGIGCFGLVVLVLWRAFRSLPLVLAAVITLLSGLLWTAAFATAAVGHLNVISIAFAVLFIGLGVDFSIHLGMRYADLLRERLDHDLALRDALGDVGGSLVLCAVTTSIGFLVFVPTDNRGVAELGLIAGAGMPIILLLTLTLFPALVHLGLRPACPSEPVSAPRLQRRWGPLERHPRTVLSVAAVLFVGSVALDTQARFEANVVRMRDPSTESVQAMNDLLADSDASPWYIDVLTPSLEAARQLKPRLEALAVVKRAVSIDDFVPRDQDEKLDILGDLSLLMDAPSSSARSAVPRLAPEQQVEALRHLHTLLEAPWIEAENGTLAASVRLLRDRLGDFLARVDDDGDPSRALANLEHVLLGTLPEQLARLKNALKAKRVTLADLPPDLVERMLDKTGEARIQVFPVENVNDEAALARFVSGVRSVWPDATGLAVNFYEFGRVTAESMREALLYAGLAIALLLWLLWRSVSDMLLAVAPLALGASATTAAMVLFGVHFNFANVCVLPLLLGIGVDSGIHLVHRSRGGVVEPSSLIASTTARAVFFSAVTTIVSFGSLALSGHYGMHSMGLLLLVGINLILASNLLVLPELIAMRAQRRARRATSSST
jgi:uncharacterized protein